MQLHEDPPGSSCPLLIAIDLCQEVMLVELAAAGDGCPHAASAVYRRQASARAHAASCREPRRYSKIGLSWDGVSTGHSRRFMCHAAHALTTLKSYVTVSSILRTLVSAVAVPGVADGGQARGGAPGGHGGPAARRAKALVGSRPGQGCPQARPRPRSAEDQTSGGGELLVKGYTFLRCSLWPTAEIAASLFALRLDADTQNNSTLIDE